jgi:prevent-host-death family protein
MRNVSATEAARRFSELLDAVEHESESFVVSRRGRVVARIEPATGATGLEVKRILGRHRRDSEWAGELADVRASLAVEDRSWPG